MFIKKLQLSNFQVIKDFDATFDGNVYFITGDNELGKSTLLKAIGALLTGERDDVLRKGEAKGFAKMVIGDDGEEYEVSLSFTEANPRGTLSIKQKTTGMQSNNVSMLQRIFGYQDFDAVEFSRWSETAEGRRKQIAVVKALLPAEIKDRIDAIDAEVENLKAERTGVNRDVKTLTSICSEAKRKLEPGDENKYISPIEVEDLMREQANNAALIEKAKSVRAALAQRVQQLSEIPGRIALANEDLEKRRAIISQKVQDALAVYEKAMADAKLMDEELKTTHERCLAQIEEERKDYEMRKANAEKWLAQYEENNPENANITERLAEASDHNKKFTLVQDYKIKDADLQKAVEKAKKMDDCITTLGAERAELIANAKLPIKGLTFSYDGLELNGVPFIPGKVSDSQIMEVAAKLVIVSNPNVKVFRIARGESLGAKRLENIVAIAKKYGYQGFIEQVERGQNDLRIEEYNER